MQVNSVGLYNNLSGLSKPQKNDVLNFSEKYTNRIQTSIYNTKGTHVYFGGLAKGIDVFENECIDLLRAARNGRKRKFAENEIANILKKLQKVKDPSDKRNVLLEVLELNEENLYNVPDNKLFETIVGLVAGRPEKERFAILEFAANEMENATKPLEIFSKLSDTQQNNLTKLLVKVDDVNRQSFFKDNDARIQIVNSLYDTFRIPLYAHEDVAGMNVFRIPGFKDKNLQILNEDMNFYKKQDCYANETAKSKILSVVDSITDYFKKSV